MKIIRNLRKSLVKEFGHVRVCNYLESIIKNSNPETPIVQEYFMMLEKPRLSAFYPPEHQLMHALLAEKLDSSLYSLYPKELISYQKGKALGDVFRDLKIFLSEYKKSCPNKSKRVLGVVKWDIKSYGESIPLHEASKLWNQLETAKLGELIPWLKSELRAVVHNPQSNDGPMSLIRGLTFGMPTTPPLNNLYLADFDRDLCRRFPDVFYRRFGDDCLLVTKDIGELQEINQWVIQELATYELRQNLNKSIYFPWTMSGFESASRIEFLGRSVNFNGRMHLTKKKQKVLIDHWKGLMIKVKRTDESYLIPTWDAFVKSPICEELYLWGNDSDSVKNLSDRLFQLTKKNFDLKKEKNYQCLFKKWHHK